MRKTCVFFSQPTSKQFSVSLYTVFWWFPNYNYLLNNVAVCTVIYYNFMLYCTLMYIVWKLFFTLKKTAKIMWWKQILLSKCCQDTIAWETLTSKHFQSAVICGVSTFCWQLRVEKATGDEIACFRQCFGCEFSDNNEMIIHIGFKLTKHCLRLYV